MSERPDLVWRAVVCRGMTSFRPTGADPDAELLAFVEEHARAEREAAGDGPSVALFILAVARLTYGQLDAADEILANLPPPRHPARMLARSLSALLPLDPRLDPAEDPGAAVAWLAAHRARLRWSEADGRFVTSAA